MLIVKLQGGLGNQLFQYAFGRRLAIIRNEELFLDTRGLENNRVIKREYGLAPFAIKAELAPKDLSLKTEYPLGLISKLLVLFAQKVLRIFYIGYEPQLLKSKAKYFSGFFQSYKYINPIRSELLNEIKLKKELGDKYSDLLREIANTNSVSLHVRRGDFISDPKTAAAHQAYSFDYYTEAIKLISSKLNNPAFFIFSDDINWVKENLKISSSVIFVSAPSTRDFEELILMSKCKHNIIANSSFSFWGAWLNQNPDKIVIAPKKWNNVYESEYKDLLPQAWLKI
ncbi:MAG: alpha-1,2-fucosyltransferase [Patescibacteria group bacterium]